MSETKQLNVYQRLSEAQAHIVAPRQESRFKGGSRSAEQILEAAKPACRQFGLLLVTNEEIEFVGERNRIKATATVINVDKPDERISSSASAWEGELTTGLDASQVSGKTGSYAKKYALQDLFAIDDTKDADFDDTKPTKAAATKPVAKASQRSDADQVLEVMTGNDAPTEAQLDRIRDLRKQLGYSESETNAKIASIRSKGVAGASIGKLKAELDRKLAAESGDAS